jgi:hypothetical protein
MKHLITICAVLLTAIMFLPQQTSAQAPNKMSYQAVIRNNANALITNTAVGMQISILQGSAIGTAVYVETQTPTTNANGLVSIEIGSVTPVTGTFAGINWANGPYFIKTETDPSGGTSYTITGTSQLLSVPYALYAESSGSSIPGPQGPIGLTGPAGPTGATGLTGPAGILADGSAAGNTPYWNGSAWVVNNSNIHNNGAGVGINTSLPNASAQLDVTSTTKGFLPPRLTTAQRDAIASPAAGLTIYNTTVNCLQWWNGTLWFDGCGNNSIVGSITALTCASATNSGTLTSGIAASGVSSSVPYTGGNGGTHNGQTVTSTGVTGLTATLAAGTFANGSGSLTYTISGTPASSGTASFVLSIGGQTCTLSLTVNAGGSGQYPVGSVFCNGQTAVVDVTSVSGKIWMDRNLGASQAATSSVDVNAYGDLYQWGRRSDGHQCRNSATTTILSSTDQPVHGDFITNSAGNGDWRSPQNDNLWQGVNGVNNPCPSGYRLPTFAELDAERAIWSPNNNSYGAIVSPLKLPLAGGRSSSTGSLFGVDFVGGYWSSTVIGTNAYNLTFSSSGAYMGINSNRANGISVRCLKD